MPSDDTRKRKACQSCTRAKAKCAPFEDRSDICYRCQRLNKPCVFEENFRKQGKRPRSRVQQLEQRVESLIDLLAPNGKTPASQTPASQPSARQPSARHLTASHLTASHSAAVRDGQNIVTTSSERISFSAGPITPAETPDTEVAHADPVAPYDPVNAGIIDEAHASSLLTDFRESFVFSFPFVVIPASTDVNTLRRGWPFLFHSIMAIMTYKTPDVQQTIAEEFKSQIASRIIMGSHKSLEILQGLLVYGAWYHFFYRPAKQQLAIILQLCVAMIQDLGLSKDLHDKKRITDLNEDQSGTYTTAQKSADSKRAFLGSYCLTTAFAQAWRKRSTMRRTRYMAQCCESLVAQLEYPSDALISPMVQLSDLTCRVNEYFSYDDIDNAEVSGEMMLDMATGNFASELERIKDAVPICLKHNTTLNLGFYLLDIWIHECSLHSPLWNAQADNSSILHSAIRIRILYRSLGAIKAYVNTLLATPESSLHHLAFPSWSGWFYTTIVACKLVFLHENDEEGRTNLEAAHNELGKQLGNLRPHELGPDVPGEYTDTPMDTSRVPFWDPVSVEKEAGIEQLFESVVEKLRFTFPSEEEAWCTDSTLCHQDPLFRMTCLQQGLLHGFRKRMADHILRHSKPCINDAGTSDKSNASPHASNLSTSAFTPVQSDAYATVPDLMGAEQHSLPQQTHWNLFPFIETWHFNSANFGTLPEAPLPSQQNMNDDWLWDTMMADFTMPLI
ncbi:hypothetical protein BDV95DRAFT_40118 [Massariosphaeria phaeospora]|uniref:Zn(2)-C6 fungal-type domain-containing protein n=1 Tax=Massariosphaeria phaeospora TaxID=100035 RepID=A0A7C8I7P3_9PLEO|nr:hypothetical protein BDV95DRAFT_40118 [Massariosphaeria phaeospora]